MRMLVGPARAWTDISGGGSIEPENMPLVQAADVQYIGSFRVPVRTWVDASFAGGGGFGMSFDPAGNGGLGSIFMSGNAVAQVVAEISIPTPDGNPAHGINDLPVAALLQGFHDPTEGDYENIYPAPGSSSYRLVGTLVDGDHLLTSWTFFYGGDYEMSSTIAKSPKNFSAGGHVGPLPFVTSGHWIADISQKWFQGAMCHVPVAWQSLLGGDAIVASSDRSRIQKNSNGPALNIFSLADVGNVNPIPVKIGVGYYYSATGGASGPLPFPDYHLACYLDGVAIPRATRSFMVVGQYGTGELTGFMSDEAASAACYGVGTSDPAYIGNPDLDNKCYTLASTNNSFHAYPYRPEMYLYDLIVVKAALDGEVAPDQIKPYSRAGFIWPEHFSISGNCRLACCIDNDSTPPRLYVAHIEGDQNESPLIHRFDIVTGA